MVRLPKTLRTHSEADQVQRIMDSLDASLARDLLPLDTSLIRSNLLPLDTSLSAFLETIDWQDKIQSVGRASRTHRQLQASQSSQKANTKQSPIAPESKEGPASAASDQFCTQGCPNSSREALLPLSSSRLRSHDQDTNPGYGEAGDRDGDDEADDTEDDNAASYV
ncbi:hypothetical protein N7493_001325 [Penicillium malachiteum]|uniref:Uncharacterized protein n=1 Tax=Penicillium malachiteum TaxID=1324776 RepID=A0AAD6HUY3_9EURO|nr:hypothetical protein N7493_001325 [Penicillium malachiteum]